MTNSRIFKTLAAVTSVGLAWTLYEFGRPTTTNKEPRTGSPQQIEQSTDVVYDRVAPVAPSAIGSGAGEHRAVAEAEKATTPESSTKPQPARIYQAFADRATPLLGGSSSVGRPFESAAASSASDTREVSQDANSEEGPTSADATPYPQRPPARTISISPAPLYASSNGQRTVGVPNTEPLELQLAPGINEPAALVASDTDLPKPLAEALIGTGEAFAEKVEKAVAEGQSDEELNATWDKAKEDADSHYRILFGDAALNERMAEAALKALGYPTAPADRIIEPKRSF